MKTIYLLPLSLVLTLTLQAGENASDGAAGSGTLSLAQVTATALANNPAIKESLRKWNAAKARIPQAAAWDDPRVVGESRVHRYVDVPPNAFTDQNKAFVVISCCCLPLLCSPVARPYLAGEPLASAWLDFISLPRTRLRKFQQFG